MSWEAPEERFTGYTVWLLGVAHTEHSTNIETRTTSFRGLVAGKQYTVVLVTVSGDQKSVALEGIFYTSKYFDYSKKGVLQGSQPPASHWFLDPNFLSPTCLWGQPPTSNQCHFPPNVRVGFPLPATPSSVNIIIYTHKLTIFSVTCDKIDTYVFR